MADSYRLLVLKALTLQLQITDYDAGGAYNFDVTDLVFRGRSRFGESDPKTMISILESPRPDTGIYAGENDSERLEYWPLLVQGWTPDDKENPSDPLYGLMDDAERRLSRVIEMTSLGYARYPFEYRLGDLITDLKFGPGVVRPPVDQVSAYAFFYLPIQLGLVRSTG